MSAPSPPLCLFKAASDCLVRLPHCSKRVFQHNLQSFTLLRCQYHFEITLLTEKKGTCPTTLRDKKGKQHQMQVEIYKLRWKQEIHSRKTHSSDLLSKTDRICPFQTLLIIIRALSKARMTFAANCIHFCKLLALRPQPKLLNFFFQDRKKGLGSARKNRVGRVSRNKVCFFLS